LGEDDQTLEGVVLAELIAAEASLAVVETFTAGQIAGRIAHLPGAERIFRRGTVVRDLAQLVPHWTVGELTQEITEQVADATRRHADATHALAVLIDLDEGTDRIDFGGSIHIAIATESGTAFRRSRILGGRDWVRLGAVELGLDCLRRFLQHLPVVERIDFEKT
ncbi:MAG TPA: CinA family protein, partial [Acetobacteraceae bacterium]